MPTKKDTIQKSSIKHQKNNETKALSPTQSNRDKITREVVLLMLLLLMLTVLVIIFYQLQRSQDLPEYR